MVPNTRQTLPITRDGSVPSDVCVDTHDVGGGGGRNLRSLCPVLVKVPTHRRLSYPQHSDPWPWVLSREPTRDSQSLPHVTDPTFILRSPHPLLNRPWPKVHRSARSHLLYVSIKLVPIKVRGVDSREREGGVWRVGRDVKPFGKDDRREYGLYNPTESLIPLIEEPRQFCYWQYLLLSFFLLPFFI